MYKEIKIISLILLVIGSVYSDDNIIDIPGDELEGANVCKRLEDYTVEVVTTDLEPYQKRVNSWCWSIPPKCEKYKIEFKQVNKTTILPKSRLIKECCAGYKKNEAGKKCIPVCDKACVRGECTKPNFCKCESGYGGPACDINCPAGMWGKKCKNPCDCLNNATCDPYNGKCICSKGYLGKKCEDTCTPDRYGDDCSEVCRCENGGKCDHISGECKCASGWMGPLCQSQCPIGTHGKDCQSQCRCQNGGVCDPLTGTCRCPPGWTGTVCANRCHGGYYGEGCLQICECFNGADCHHITGNCTCASGFLGDKCLDTCPYNMYGEDCKETCQCKNGAKCDSSSGHCDCKPGWTGSDCSERICPDDKYGENCTNSCDCNVENTEMCHPWDGTCDCKPGFSSDNCGRACTLYTYGKHCKTSCDCKNGAPCSPFNGTCLCLAGFRGLKCEETCPEGAYGQNCTQKCDCLNGGKCSPETGQCFCAPGFQGIKCDRPCDIDKYGENCGKVCTCHNNGVCNPKNGECFCSPGFKGEKCENKCDTGFFGMNCSQPCDCVESNTHRCDPVTGRCICKTQWGGVRCESQCPVGFFGEDCEHQCNCKNNSSCDPLSGDCICERGWMGSDCSKPCMKGYYGHGCKEKCPEVDVTNKTCDHVTGEYKCRSGYIGLTCEHPCPLGNYGPDCSLKCTCKNGGECSHVTGACTCYPGWTGASCSEACPDGTYGPNCTQLCKCRNNTKCRKSDGMCICEPGFMGTRCEDVCPEGFYGVHCIESCDCPNANFVCQPVKGCVCKSGFRGHDCREAALDQRIGEHPDTNELDSQLDGEYLKVRSENESGTGLTFKNTSITNNATVGPLTNNTRVIVNDVLINNNTDPSTAKPEWVETINVTQLMEEFEEINKNISEQMPENREIDGFLTHSFEMTTTPVSPTIPTSSTLSRGIVTNEMERDHPLDIHSILKSNSTIIGNATDIFTIIPDASATSLSGYNSSGTIQTAVPRDFYTNSTPFTFSSVDHNRREETTEMPGNREIFKDSTELLLTTVTASPTGTQRTTDSLYHPKFPGSVFTIRTTSEGYETREPQDANSTSGENVKTTINPLGFDTTAATNFQKVDQISGKNFSVKSKENSYLNESNTNFQGQNQGTTSSTIQWTRNLTLEKDPIFHPKFPGSTFYVTDALGNEGRGETTVSSENSYDSGMPENQIPSSVDRNQVPSNSEFSGSNKSVGVANNTSSNANGSIEVASNTSSGIGTNGSLGVDSNTSSVTINGSVEIIQTPSSVITTPLNEQLPYKTTLSSSSETTRNTDPVYHPKFPGSSFAIETTTASIGNTYSNESDGNSEVFKNNSSSNIPSEAEGFTNNSVPGNDSRFNTQNPLPSPGFTSDPFNFSTISPVEVSTSNISGFAPGSATDLVFRTTIGFSVNNVSEFTIAGSKDSMGSTTRNSTDMIGLTTGRSLDSIELTTRSSTGMIGLGTGNSIDVIGLTTGRSTDMVGSTTANLLNATSATVIPDLSGRTSKEMSLENATEFSPGQSTNFSFRNSTDSTILSPSIGNPADFSTINPTVFTITNLTESSSGIFTNSTSFSTSNSTSSTDTFQKTTSDSSVTTSIDSSLGNSVNNSNISPTFSSSSDSFNTSEIQLGFTTTISDLSNKNSTELSSGNLPGFLANNSTDSSILNSTAVLPGISSDNNSSASNEDEEGSLNSTDIKFGTTVAGNLNASEEAADPSTNSTVNSSSGNSSATNSNSSVSNDERFSLASSYLFSGLFNRTGKELFQYYLTKVRHDEPSNTDQLIGNSDPLPTETATNAGIVWGIVGSLLFAVIIILLLLYYRRRVENLKAEINHVVKYMSDAPPGHFDNPVYSFQQPPSTQGDTSTLLEHSFMNNIRRNRPPLDHLNVFTDDSNNTSRAGAYSIDYDAKDFSQKNREADLTNPNIYSSIDDHVYDEIKNKDGYKDTEVEYDHLDYSRPSASFKPHYHRMTGELSMCSNASTVLMDSISPPSTSNSNKFEEKEVNHSSIVPPPKQLNISVPPLPEKKHSPVSSIASNSSTDSTATQDDNIDKFDVEKPVDKNFDSKDLENKEIGIEIIPQNVVV